MYLISDKYVVSEMGSYFQLAVTLFFGLTPRQCSVSEFILTSPLSITLDLPLLHAITVTKQKKTSILKISNYKNELGIQVIKSSETRDEMILLQWNNPYFGIEKNHCYNMPM